MNMKKIVLFIIFIFTVFSLAKVPEGSTDFFLRIIDLPFPPYQRNIIRFFELDDGRIYGIIARSEFTKGAVFVIEKNEKVIQKEKLPDEIFQPEDVIFNSDLTWTWNKDFTRIIVLDNEGLLKIVAKDVIKEIARISGTRPFEPEGYQVSRSFAHDASGNLYTAGKDGILYKFNLENYKLEKLNVRLPAVKGREPWASLDAATLADDGTIYMGTFDGYLVQFDPEKQTIINPVSYTHLTLPTS
ncbi:MAG: hypothetical protein N2115_08650, partial [bacterium]|nr:hypothetical protein [bacterium]